MIVYSWCNQKGGVGKTTGCANTGSSLSKNGKRVLMIDFDPQGNLSDAFDVVVEDGQPTVYDVLKANTDIKDAVVNVDGIDVLPADIDLASLEPELLGQTGREFLLRKILKDVEDSYDYCLIDCPPSLGVLVSMALTASDYVVVPTTAARYATKGIIRLMRTINVIQEYTNPNLKVAGFLFSLFDTRTKNAQRYVGLIEQLAAQYNCRIFTTRIRRAVAVEEAANEGKPSVLHNGESKPAEDYSNFTQELISLR